MGNEGRPLGPMRRGNVAGLSTAGGFSASYRPRMVTDARHAGDTATGGGSTAYPAYYDGAAWQQMVPRYAVSATLSADETTVTATAETLSWSGTEDYDYGGLHDTVTNPSRITANVKGVWHVLANVEWVSNATGNRRIQILKNGTAVRADTLNAVNGLVTQNNISLQLELDAGDYVEVEVRQTSGGDLDVRSAKSYFMASLVLPTSDAVAASLALLETGDSILFENSDRMALE